MRARVLSSSGTINAFRSQTCILSNLTHALMFLWIVNRLYSFTPYKHRLSIFTDLLWIAAVPEQFSMQFSGARYVRVACWWRREDVCHVSSADDVMCLVSFDIVHMTVLEILIGDWFGLIITNALSIMKFRKYTLKLYIKLIQKNRFYRV